MRKESSASSAVRGDPIPCSGHAYSIILSNVTMRCSDPAQAASPLRPPRRTYRDHKGRFASAAGLRRLTNY